MEVQYIQIADVLVLDRLRKDLGDLDRLAESVKEKGMINPIIVTANIDRNTKRQHKWVLLCGYRRLVAARDILGWTAVPAECRVCFDARDMLTWEAAENTLLQYSSEEVKSAKEHFAIIKTAWDGFEVEPEIEVVNPFKLSNNATQSRSEPVTITASTITPPAENAAQAPVAPVTAHIMPERERTLLAEIERLKNAVDGYKRDAEKSKKLVAEYEREIDKILDENVSLRVKLGM